MFGMRESEYVNFFLELSTRSFGICQADCTDILLYCFLYCCEFVVELNQESGYVVLGLVLYPIGGQTELQI